VHLACQKTKEGFTEAVVKEVCKMARAAADELQRRAMEASVKEMLSPVQAKEFLKAVEDIISMVRRHGTKATRRPDGGSVSCTIRLFAFLFRPPSVSDRRRSVFAGKRK
jgi:hypothetical protein